MGANPKGFDESNIHSFNRYAYGNNNPYRFVDPDGRDAVDSINNWWNASVAGFKSEGPGDAAMRVLAGLPVEMGAIGAMGMIEGTTTSVTKSAGAIGRDGEAAVRRVAEIGEKIKFEINGRVRIRDGVTDKVLTEIKNVQNLSLTQQLRDYMDIASQTGRSFDLWVRETTELSGPLLEKIETGLINLRIIPDK